MSDFVNIFFGLTQLKKYLKNSLVGRGVSQILGGGAIQLIIVLCIGAVIPQVRAQSRTDFATLTLRELLEEADRFYPALRAARVESQASLEDVDAVRRQRWAALSMNTETNTGNLRVYPNKVVQVQQTLWDFGLISSRIAEAEAASDVSFLDVSIQRQDLFLQIISAWQSLQASKARFAYATGTLARLDVYKQQMMRRVSAEVSPRIDLELVDARLLQTRVEQVAAKAAEQLALTRLESLTGIGTLSERVERVELIPNLAETSPFMNAIKGLDWSDIAVKSPRLARARAKIKQAEQRLESKKAEALPQIYARVYKPLDVLPYNSDTSTTTFVGLSYSTGSGLATLAEAKALGTRISAAQISVESERLDELQILLSDQEEFLNSRLRIDALEKAVMGSYLVLASYQRQFEAGKKTWLDLLNAVRELAQNEYSLADARAGMLGSMGRLQLRMGVLQSE